jgi:Omp85 superfamily domain
MHHKVSRARIVAPLLTTGLLLAAPFVASAQDSRESTITAEQGDKARRLAPYTPSKAEAVLSEVLDWVTPEPNGFYPYFGSVYSGGGFTLGAGYRHFISDHGTIAVSGLYSVKNYKLFEVGLNLPGTSRARPEFALRAGWRDATQVAYHGLGIESPEDRTAFRMQQGYAGGQVTARAKSWAVFKAGLTYEDFTLSEGAGSDPSIEEVHTPATAPGLGANPAYLHINASAALDTRLASEYARRGMLYELAYHKYSDTDDTYSFDRLDAEIIHHVPILRENWVLSLRGRLQTTLSDTDIVPYFLLPSLGSGSTLRGYSSWRFRDRHSALFSGEYRWTPSRLAMDAAFFYDAGTVADRLDALSIGKMESDVGFGVRFHTPISTPLRIELAKGREGLRLVFAGSAAF